MAILSDYEEEDQKLPQKPTVTPKPFSTTLDPSNPIAFLQSAFEFVANEADFFANDSSEKAVADLFKKVKEKHMAEIEKKKKQEAAAAAAANASVASSSSKKNDVSPMDEDKDDSDKEKLKYRGIQFLIYLISIIVLFV